MDASVETLPRRRFVLLRTLGEGTFGSVFLADMEGAGGFRRRVALKLLNRTWDPASDAGRRLRDEARLLGRLQHRHIVRVDDLVRVNGQWALLMEYISGADIETLFNQSRARGLPFPQRAALEICAAIAAALDAAWAAEGDDRQPLRVIHRDIKPSNVRLSEGGDVKVLDFGVARADFEGREAKTERVRYGSLGYMAPERLLGEPEAPSGDVYALGVILYELLALETFGRSELAEAGQQAQVTRAETQVLDRLGPEGAPVVDLLSRALSYAPGRRPTAHEMEMELRALARIAPGDDIHGYARAMLPLLGVSAPTGADPVEGTVLEETTTAIDPAQRVNPSAEHTVVGGLGARALQADPPISSGTIVLPDEPEPPPKRAPPWAWIGAAVGAVALGIGVAVWATRPDAAPTLSDAAATMPPPVPAQVQVVEPPAAPAAAAQGDATAAPSAPEPAATTSARSAATPAPEAGRAAQTRTAATSASPAGAVPTAAAASAATPPAPAASSGPRLRSAKFTLTGADPATASISVTCGDVTGSGSTSALLRELPPGPCTVRAAGLTTTVTVEVPRGVSCTVEGGSLTCS